MAAGTYHTVALKSDGTVVAWGGNSSGELGDNQSCGTTCLTPVQVLDVGGVGNLSGVVAIAAGAGFSVALKSDGTVVAWGDEQFGELGNGQGGCGVYCLNFGQFNGLIPVQVFDVGGVGNLSGVTAVAAGGVHAVALKADGTVVAWGDNFVGELGDNLGCGIYCSTPVQVLDVGGIGNLSGVVAVVAGDSHSVALKANGTVAAWGWDYEGELGDNRSCISGYAGSNLCLTPVNTLEVGGVGVLNLLFYPLTISTSSLPNATVGIAYSQTLAATGGEPPYTWSISGSLPAGLNLNASTGVISGTPTTESLDSFTVSVTATNDMTESKVLSLNVLGVDLTVSALSSPSLGGSVLAGSSITVNDTVSNIGNGTTTYPLGILVNYYLGGTPIGSRTIASLAAGATNSASSTFTIAASFTPGSYQLSATVDPNNVQPETNENNNTTIASGTVTVVRNVDLVPTSLSSSSSVTVGSSITISDTVANQGTTPTFSPTGILVNYYLGGTLIGNRTIASLAAGATSSASSTFGIPASFATGTYTLSETVDPGNYQPETNKSNNTLAAAGTVTVNGSVDLVPTSLGASPSSVVAGGNFTVTDTVANTGISPTSASSFRVNYYLSTDTTITAADTLLGGRNISSIAAGGTNTASTLVSVPTGLAPGVYYVGEIVDSGNAQPETNKANNTLATVGTITVTALVGGVDLLPTSLNTTATSVYTGGSITINDSVMNQGNKATSASILVNYYLSTNTIPLNGTLIGNRTIASLAAGVTNSASSAFTIPATFAPGVYYLGIIVNKTQSQVETNYANDTMATVGTVTVVRNVDLVPTSLSTTATSVSRGGSCTVTDTVANQGASPTSASSFRVNYYLSTDTTITAADTLIGGRNISSIAAGGSNTASTSVNVPAGLAPGVYYVGEIVDSANAQPETNKANNTAATVGTITVN